uniref:Putative secreted protein n=1 Tax=Anopheles darlingi TaxID=43151 RepID=A0A2M4D7I6_ANODA
MSIHFFSVRVRVCVCALVVLPGLCYGLDFRTCSGCNHDLTSAYAHPILGLLELEDGVECLGHFSVQYAFVDCAPRPVACVSGCQEIGEPNMLSHVACRDTWSDGRH